MELNHRPWESLGHGEEIMTWRKRKTEDSRLEFERTKARIEYLTKQYDYYTSHMSQVFNFYLISAALVAGAFVQSMSGAHPISANGSSAIAYAGAAMTFLFGLLHWRAFQVAEVLDDLLEKEAETELRTTFQKRRSQSQKILGFFTPREPKSARTSTQSRKPWVRLLYLRNTNVFFLIYFFFFSGFFCVASQVEQFRSARADAQAPAALVQPIIDIGSRRN